MHKTKKMDFHGMTKLLNFNKNSSYMFIILQQSHFSVCEVLNKIEQEEKPEGHAIC